MWVRACVVCVEIHIYAVRLGIHNIKIPTCILKQVDFYIVRHSHRKICHKICMKFQTESSFHYQFVSLNATLLKRCLYSTDSKHYWSCRTHMCVSWPYRYQAKTHSVIYRNFVDLYLAVEITSSYFTTLPYFTERDKRITAWNKSLHQQFSVGYNYAPILS